MLKSEAICPFCTKSVFTYADRTIDRIQTGQEGVLRFYTNIPKQYQLMCDGCGCTCFTQQDVTIPSTVIEKVTSDLVLSLD